MALIGDPIYEYYSNGFRGQPRNWITLAACLPAIEGLFWVTWLVSLTRLGLISPPI